MKMVFVDTLYWIARINPKDQWYAKAIVITSQLQSVTLLTTELVLIEFLNYFCGYGTQMRQTVSNVVRDTLQASNVRVIHHNHELFELGLKLYEMRLNKGYSLTDCVSMVVMREHEVQDVLTHDRHFAQEGFTVLL